MRQHPAEPKLCIEYCDVIFITLNDVLHLCVDVLGRLIATN
jgi:hypothetical protein